MDWDKLRIFQSVAEDVSLSHAAIRLNLSQPAVSRAIRQLERELGGRLFHRHSRGMTLTEAGQLLKNSTGHFQNQISEVQDRIANDKENPEGILHLQAEQVLGITWLVDRLGSFFLQYPQLSVRIKMSDNRTDCFDSDIDVKIQYHQPSDSPDLIATRLFSFSQGVYASAQYIRRHGEPQTLEDLDRAILIANSHYSDLALTDVYSESTRIVNWLLHAGCTRGQPRQPRLTVNSQHAVYRAIRHGVGIGSLPLLALPEYKHELVRILRDVPAPDLTAYFVYASEKKGNKKITVLRQFLLDELDRSQEDMVT